MKANKTHISLETAKLLKDCGVESEQWFVNTRLSSSNPDYRVSDCGGDSGSDYPAYTWQEILWENAEKFFGRNNGYYRLEDKHNEVAEDILYLLQQKKYEEADEYFRKNCILIK